jgi:uncharacterized protein (DUF885 family)
MRAPSLFLALAVVFPAAAASQASGAHSTPPSNPAAIVRAVADEYVALAVQRSPALAEQLGDPTLPDRWSDNSPAGLRAWQAREDGWIARLAMIDEASLFGAPEWLVYGMLREALEASRARRVCREELWGGVDQIFGWHLDLASSAARQAVGGDEARARALARWRDVPRFVDNEIANAREGLAAGYSAPRANVERVIEQVRGMLPDSLERSPLWSLAARDSVPEFREAFARVLRDGVHPALRRYLHFLEGEYLPRARAEPGLSALPDGAACYRAIVRGYTSLDIAPEDLIRQARGARQEMEAELAPLARRLTGVADLREARRILKSDPSLAFGSRDARFVAAAAQLDSVRERLPRAFSHVPSTPLVLQAAPAFRERSSPPAWYEPAPLDGSRPGTYWLNLFGAETAPRMDLAPSVTHEGWPGHHLQIAWAAERPVPHPAMRILSTGAFVEGWGMYAERLAYETEMVTDDLMRAGLLSHLTDALLGLEIDPGMHVFGWTRPQAVDSMMIVTGRPRAQAESYADRHAATPGQIVTYMVGYLEIVRLREKARTALGERFDLREFHDVVLETGAVTLPMLRTKVEGWIQGRRAS